jgi:hypothetical protein
MAKQRVIQAFGGQTYEKNLIFHGTHCDKRLENEAKPLIYIESFEI